MATSWLKLPISISEVFEWEASPVEGQSLQQKDLKHKKPKDVGHAKFWFLRMPKQKYHKIGASGKKSMLLGCECFFE